MPNLKIWSNREIGRLKRDMDRLFDSLCTDYGLPGAFSQEEMEVEESLDSIEVRLTVPGLRAKDLEVNVTELGLDISGQRERVDGNHRTVEGFHRSLGLPCRVLPDEVKATFKNGVLTITMPKCQGAQCRSIDITKE